MLWLASAAAGLAALASYAAAPAPLSDAPRQWPAESAVERRPRKATVLLFLHPHCPCSRATIEMLDRSLSRAGGEHDVLALVYAPSSMGASWPAGSLWDRATELPGVRVMKDPDGVEARRFGATASGHVVVYDARGLLRFQGGVTASRGHEGDSLGTDALTAVLRDRAPLAVKAPTYGCEIDPAAATDGCPLCTEDPTP